VSAHWKDNSILNVNSGYNSKSSLLSHRKYTDSSYAPAMSQVNQKTDYFDEHASPEELLEAKAIFITIWRRCCVTDEGLVGSEGIAKIKADFEERMDGKTREVWHEINTVHGEDYLNFDARGKQALAGFFIRLSNYFPIGYEDIVHEVYDGSSTPIEKMYDRLVLAPRRRRAERKKKLEEEDKAKAAALEQAEDKWLYRDTKKQDLESNRRLGVGKIDFGSEK
jgi:hypothetical protein